MLLAQMIDDFCVLGRTLCTSNHRLKESQEKASYGKAKQDLYNRNAYPEPMPVWQKPPHLPILAANKLFFANFVFIKQKSWNWRHLAPMHR